MPKSFCTTSLQVLFGLPLSLAPYISYSLHFFTIHCLLFAAHANTIATCFAVVPRLCHLILVSLSLHRTVIFYPNATHPSDHSPLCPLKCCFIFLSYGPGGIKAMANWQTWLLLKMAIKTEVVLALCWIKLNCPVKTMWPFDDEFSCGVGWDDTEWWSSACSAEEGRYNSVAATWFLHLWFTVSTSKVTTVNTFHN